jgi:IS1 family transposase
LLCKHKIYLDNACYGKHITIMNKLTVSERAAIIRGLAEGNSIRSVGRMTGHSKGAVLRLLVEVGEFCSIYQDHALRNLSCKRIEADEIWGYVGAKEKNATKDSQGDLWTYTAICADSKLVVSWLVGRRNHTNTQAFMRDVAARLAHRVQLTTDGLGWYLSAVENAFGWNRVDYAQLVKTYGLPLDELERQRRYSPMVCTGAIKTQIMGNPEMEKVSTSYVERANLSIRMGMRRMTRLTNGFSKKAENHAHAFAIHMMFYNFCRAHMTLTKAANGIKTTPAMASGLTHHVWTVEEVLGLMDPKRLLQ